MFEQINQIKPIDHEKEFLALHEAKKAIRELIESSELEDIVWNICSKKKLPPFHASPKLREDVLRHFSGKDFRFDIKKFGNYKNFSLAVSKAVDAFNKQKKMIEDQESLKEPIGFYDEADNEIDDLNKANGIIGIRPDAEEYDPQKHRHWQD